jgi:membrane-associated phospholipid phosphatase
MAHGAHAPGEVPSGWQRPGAIGRRIRRTLSLRAALWLGAAGVGTIVFTVIAAQLVRGRADGFDLAVTREIRRVDSPALDAVVRVITDLGSWQVCILASLATAVWAVHRRHWRAVWVVMLAYLVAEGVNQTLKLIFARDRPALFDKISRPDSYSFPSGHAMSALVLYGVIAAVVIKYRPDLRWVVLPAAVLVILAVGLSRIYLGVHWTLDVIGGFAAGVPLLAVAVHIFRHPPRPQRGAGSGTVK